jgi:hypothetical protein
MQIMQVKGVTSINPIGCQRNERMYHAFPRNMQPRTEDNGDSRGIVVRDCAIGWSSLAKLTLAGLESVSQAGLGENISPTAALGDIGSAHRNEKSDREA